MAAKFSNKFIGRKTSATLRKVKLIYAFVLSLVLVLRPHAGTYTAHNGAYMTHNGAKALNS